MESQIETMRGSIAALKGQKPVKEKKKKDKREKVPVASTSKAAPKPAKTSSKKKGSKKPIADDDVLTFEQKKDLSESIGKLEGTKLEKVIQIIHEGVPEIRDVRVAPFVDISNSLLFRVRMKSNSRLISCRRPSSLNCTISLFALCVHPRQSAIGPARAQGLGG